MNIIVIDLEWNFPETKNGKVPGLRGEIIQIGAARIDADCNILGTYCTEVKPAFYKSVNKHVSELTLLTDKDLEKGIPFGKAAEELRAWCGDDPVFVSWGPDDYYMLQNNLWICGMDHSWLPKTYDAQLMFDDMEKQEDRQFPLNYALWYFDEKPDGIHNALADVISTVKVLSHLDIEEGLSDEYFRCDDIDLEDRGSELDQED